MLAQRPSREPLAVGCPVVILMDVFIRRPHKKIRKMLSASSFFLHREPLQPAEGVEQVFGGPHFGTAVISFGAVALGGAGNGLDFFGRFAELAVKALFVFVLAVVCLVALGAVVWCVLRSVGA